MTNLTIGDIVIAKHNNIWQKGCITKINSHPYYKGFYITFDKESVDDSYIPYNRSDIIKVGSDFYMGCCNCKYRTKGCFDQPCNGCLVKQHYYWEPCYSLKNKDKLNGNDIKTFSIDEGPFTDKIEKLDAVSFYPKFENKQKIKPDHYSDDIDALRYYMDDVRATAELMADFNKKENKDMKKQQKKRDRNIIKVKDLETRKIKEIMFNGPATIIKWEPTVRQQIWNEKADKTVVVCKESDSFDKTTGFLLAVLKEILDNKSYGNILEKIDELSKQDIMADLNNKTELHHCSIKDLKEQTEALENVYVPGSVVKFKNGKKNYMVISYRFDEQLKEMVYILRPYKGAWYSDLEGTRKKNVPHSRLIMVRRK